MNDVEDVWWCRTPTVVYGSGERRIRGQRRIALHFGAVNKIDRAAAGNSISLRKTLEHVSVNSAT
jgi:hypothetical protein